MGNGGCSQFITRCLCHCFLLGGRTPHTLPCSSVGSLPGQTVLHELLERGSFPQAAALHKLPQRGSFPRGAVLQEQAAPGSAAPGRSLLQCRLSIGLQLPSGIPLLRRGVPSTGCRWRSATPWTSMDCRDSLPHHGLLHGLQGNLCSGTWSTSCPSFCTDLGVCRAISLTSSHSYLSTAVPQQVFPILKCVIT